MDFSFLFKDVHVTIKRLAVNFAIVLCFWTIPFYLFKPEILKEPLYIQFFLVFCLCFVWIAFNFIIMGIISILTDDKENKFTPELTTLLSIFSLCIFILISYYYSDSFTLFLRRAFITIVGVSCVPLTLGSLVALVSKK